VSHAIALLRRRPARADAGRGETGAGARAGRRSPDETRPGSEGTHWYALALPVQAKLEVGAPGDAYEEEADRVADQVMRMPGPAAADDENDVLQRMPSQPETDEEREEPIQAKAQAGDAGLDPDAAERAMLRSGSGSSLPSALRLRMEDGIGADFSAVRVHMEAAADDAARALNARAITRGGDIYLARGESRSDPRLMGHELAHVVQQGAAGRASDRSRASPKVGAAAIVQRWEGIEHKTVGNRAQNRFPFRGTISINMTVEKKGVRLQYA
jgi:hypothetical protein